jgi:hypothetical protein
MRVKIWFCISALLFASGCGRQIEDFVKNGAVIVPKDLIGGPPIDPTVLASERTISLSSGSSRLSSGQLQGTVQINSRNTHQKGSSVDVVFSINSQRVE